MVFFACGVLESVKLCHDTFPTDTATDCCPGAAGSADC